jgi:hypothetical protein
MSILLIKDEGNMDFLRILTASGIVQGSSVNLTNNVRSYYFYEEHVPVIVGNTDIKAMYKSYKPIKPYEISRFISSTTLVFPGSSLMDTPLFTEGNLIFATLNIWKEDGKELPIYNNNTNFFHHIENGEDLTLIGNGATQGFAIIQPIEDLYLTSDWKVPFSFTCTIESDGVTEDLFENFKVALNGVRTP